MLKTCACNGSSRYLKSIQASILFSKKSPVSQLHRCSDLRQMQIFSGGVSRTERALVAVPSVAGYQQRSRVDVQLERVGLKQVCGCASKPLYASLLGTMNVPSNIIKTFCGITGSNE